ncbi:MAG: hypothetical protein ABJA84_07430 [Polaromonas sp.]
MQGKNRITVRPPPPDSLTLSDYSHAPLLEIASVQALLGAAQFNVLEFHTGNATSRSISKPDRMTFDLAPPRRRWLAPGAARRATAQNPANGFGATTVAAWSARAHPGMGVSVPVAWGELASLTGSAHWTASTLGARLHTGNQPWDGYESSRKSLSAAMKKLCFQLEA